MTDGMFKAKRMAKNPKLWELYYAMLEENDIHHEGAGFYPLFWKCAKAALKVMERPDSHGQDEPIR